MKTVWDVIKGPVITEKALKLKEESTENNKQLLSFRVASDASKQAIKQAVETIFQVKVDTVRIINYRGKEVRRGRTLGRKPDWKKAYVTLREGERTIDYGDSI
jgi:large subunit ribosomal protein L23